MRSILSDERASVLNKSIEGFDSRIKFYSIADRITNFEPDYSVCEFVYTLWDIFLFNQNTQKKLNSEVTLKLQDKPGFKFIALSPIDEEQCLFKLEFYYPPKPRLKQDPNIK